MLKPVDTKQAIIDRARDLLHSRGFDGFSYKDISSHLGIKNAAVHYHFPSKVDLGLAMIERYIEEVTERIRWARETGVSPKEQLDAFFQQIESELCDRHWTVCALGAMCTSFDEISEPMQHATQRLGTLVHDWMTETLQTGRSSGNFRFAGSPEHKALEISCAVQGARQLSRIRGENVVAQVADQIRKDLYQ